MPVEVTMESTGGRGGCVFVFGVCSLFVFIIDEAEPFFLRFKRFLLPIGLLFVRFQPQLVHEGLVFY